MFRINRSKSAALAPAAKAVPRQSWSSAPGKGKPVSGVMGSMINSPFRRRCSSCGVKGGARNPLGDWCCLASLDSTEWT